MTFLLTYSVPSCDFSVRFDLLGWNKWEDVKLLLPEITALAAARRGGAGRGGADPPCLGGLHARTL